VERLFVDLSAWVCFVDRSDPHHKRVGTALKRFVGRLVTTNFVFDETVTFCQRRLSHAIAVSVGDLLRDPGTVDLVRVENQDEDSAWRLLKDRRDKRYSFTDCTSFVVMRRLGLERAATLDAEFAQEGFIVVP